MKYTLSLLPILVMAYTILPAQDRILLKETGKFYSLEEARNKEGFDNFTYPTPVMGYEQVVRYLNEHVQFPEKEKKGYHNEYASIPLTITKEGKAIYKGDAVFKSAAISEQVVQILTDSNFKWKAGSKANIKREMTITIPVSYATVHNGDMLYFVARYFINFPNIALDSSRSFPAMLWYEKEHKFDLNESFLLIPASKDPERTYGTVTVGIEIDTSGSIREYKITNSISPQLDSMALAYLKTTDRAWKPARKNGIKVPSYKYFNCKFNDVYVEPWNVKENYTTERLEIESRYRLKRYSNVTLAHHDYFMAMELQRKKDYPAALRYFDKAALYFIDDANLFYNRSVCNLNIGENGKACLDLQRCLDIAELQGYPNGLSAETINNLLVKFCTDSVTE